MIFLEPDFTLTDISEAPAVNPALGWGCTSECGFWVTVCLEGQMAFACYLVKELSE